MRGLLIATALLVALAVPLGVGLVGTAGRYLETTRDLANLRTEVVGWRTARADGGGYRRALPGPDVTLRFSGSERVPLTLAEVNFELTWQGTRLGTAAAFPRQAIPRGGMAEVTVETNLEPGQEARLAELLARGDPGLLIAGQARIVLPNGGGGILFDLRGRLPAGAAGAAGGRP